MHTEVISYLDELATCQPSRKSWDELVWPPQSAVPVSPCERVSVDYLQGHIMELGPKMPPMQFHASHPSGAFICFTRGLVFEGSVLTYDPTTNQAEWVPMRGMAADLLLVEERLALALGNLVLRDEDEAEERIDSFGERRDTGGAMGGGAKEDPSHEAPCIEAPHNDEMEEMDEESRGQGEGKVGHLETDDDVEVDADEGDDQSDLESMGQGPC